LIITYTFPKLRIVYEIPDLYGIVLQSLKNIPQGKITTYGEISRALGDKIAARAVGYIMATNKWPEIFPCYRVVGKNGELGGYSLGIEKKKRLLRKDGIKISGGKILDFENIVLKSEQLKLPPVLESLQRLQSFLSSKLDLSKSLDNFNIVASLDLGYISGPPDIGIATACLYDVQQNKVLSLGISIVPVFMPYIPTYLAFRELPSALLALESVINYRTPDILAVDGQGILHPRRFGIASHIGVITGIPSIGIAKSILVGKIRPPWRKHNHIEYAPIEYMSSIYGYAIRKEKHMIIVSPGHDVSIESALQIALNLEWRNRDKEPYVMMIPHIVATRFRQLIKQMLDKYTKKQTDITGFLTQA